METTTKLIIVLSVFLLLISWTIFEILNKKRIEKMKKYPIFDAFKEKDTYTSDLLDKKKIVITALVIDYSNDELIGIQYNDINYLLIEDFKNLIKDYKLCV